MTAPSDLPSALRYLRGRAGLMGEGFSFTDPLNPPKPLAAWEVADQCRLTALKIRGGHFALDAGPFFAEHAERAAVAVERFGRIVAQGHPPAALPPVIDSGVLDAREFSPADFEAFLKAVQPELPKLSDLAALTLAPEAGTKPRVIWLEPIPGGIIATHF